MALNRVMERTAPSLPDAEHASTMNRCVFPPLLASLAKEEPVSFLSQLIKEVVLGNLGRE